ncbi:MAG TPA: phospholipid scramblase-related protein [Actinomycetota bacterium]|nr:phospholipid scramblase-related protein [Actinomycetota bacterium]
MDDEQRVMGQVERAAASGAFAGGGTLFTEPVLVVNQKTKLIELTNEYSVFDAAGKRLGAVRQTGQTTLKKALRLVSSVDQFMTHTLEVTDASGATQLTLTRPRKIFKSTIVVARPDGTEVGRIVQENMVGKIRFGIQADGTRVGGIQGENWIAWNFAITDGSGAEIGRITKTWEGLARTAFTTADQYVVQIHKELPEPLRSLVVASALCVDTALKQDDRGFN